MPNINQLQKVNLGDLINQNKAAQNKKPEESEGKKDFGQTITDFVNAVNNTQKQSAQETSDVIQGKSDNLHQAMATMEEARLSFQLMIEIRNKLMESYQEVQRMQV